MANMHAVDELLLALAAEEGLVQFQKCLRSQGWLKRGHIMWCTLLSAEFFGQH